MTGKKPLFSVKKYGVLATLNMYGGRGDLMDNIEKTNCGIGRFLNILYTNLKKLFYRQVLMSAKSLPPPLILAGA